jgi:hypothetical protein
MENHQSLYVFLEPYLENGTAAEIAAARKSFWKEYRKNWNRQKRSEQKEIAVFYSKKEFRIIESAAQAHKLSCSKFVKESSLAYCSKEFIVHNQETVQDITLALARTYNLIQTLTDEQCIEEQTGERVMAKIESLETVVLGKLHNPVPLEDLIAGVVKEKPESKQTLLAFIQRLQ